MPERLHRTARDIMDASPATLDRTASISDAVQLLADRDIACAVIVDEARKPVGIITEGDLLALAQTDGSRARTMLARLLQEEHHFFDTLRGLRKATATSVGDAMSKPVECVEADATIGRVAHLMETFDYRQIPVVDDGRLVGLVSRQDVVRAIADAS